MRKSNGITLIALVITIIILLILAGISIAMLTGSNGLLTKALKAKEEHLISGYKEELNLIIMEEVAQRTTETKEEPMIVSIEKKVKEKDWVNKEKVKQYNEEGITEEKPEKNKYLFVESKEGYEFIIEVDNENETAKIIEVNKTPREEYTITYHPNGGAGERIEKKIKAGFSVRLDSCSYSKDKFKFVGWCEKTNPDSEAILYSAGSKYPLLEGNVTLYAIWESTVATVTFDSNDGTGRTQTVEVLKGKDTKLPENTIEREGYELVKWNTKADGSGTAYEEGDTINTTQDITLYIIWEKQREAPEDWKITKKTDAEWYNYTNLSNNTTAKVNPPKLTGQMKPIKYIGESQTGSKWANAITMDGSMWVWIPRYAYRITSGYHTSTAGTIDVAFLDTQNNFLNGETGTLVTEPSEVTYTNDVQDQWLVHPAFTSSAENGGGFGELEGIWVGKFGVARPPQDSKKLAVLPGKGIALEESIGSGFTLAKNSKFGETETINSHMMKNSEWGMMLYLAHSKYGTNGKKVQKNENGYTGGNSVVKEIYKANKKQSSTYNANGVYDLNGGYNMCSASYVLDSGGDEMWLKYSGGDKAGCLYGATKQERTSSTAYKMVYEVLGDEEKNYENSKKYKGDAIYETSDRSVGRYTGSWFGSYAGFPHDNYPFFLRNTSGVNSSASDSMFFCWFSQGRD